LSARRRPRRARGSLAAPRLKEPPQQAADALHNAAKQPEDACQEPTYCATEATKNAHLTSVVRRGLGTRATGRTLARKDRPAQPSSFVSQRDPRFALPRIRRRAAGRVGHGLSAQECSSRIATLCSPSDARLLPRGGSSVSDDRRRPTSGCRVAFDATATALAPGGRSGDDGGHHERKDSIT
jgi:hypothetical protein